MKSITIVCCLLLLCSCGNAPRPAASGFVNETPQSSAFLWAQWHAAQAQVLAGGEDLTRIRTIAEHTPPTILAGDPRATAIGPKGLIVESMPDMRPGQVACPQPCDVGYSVAYSEWGENVVYAASWNSRQYPAALESWLQYEFASQILWQLGYSVAWR